MRRILASLVSVMLVFAIAGPVVAANGPTTVYLALGDSAAWGDGASVPDHTGYVPRLAGYFQGARHGGADQLVNLGVRGESTASIFTSGQLAGALATINDPDTDVRMVTLSIGGNDLLDLLNDPDDPCRINPASDTCRLGIALALGQVYANLPLILGSLHAALANDPGTEKLFVLLLYNPFGGMGGMYEEAVDRGLRGSDLTIDCAANQSDPLKVGLDDVLGCWAAYFDDVVVDAYPVFGDNALALTHMGEGFNIHPNDEGYALLAWAHRVADRAS
jgi:lysophospholipase L1-like esterase